MTGNTFGQAFAVTTFGESHGAGLGAVVDGCPPGIELSEQYLQRELDRRRPGASEFTTQRNESDKVRILSGMFEGYTTGTPIGLLIENVDQKSADYSDIRGMYRPSHADYSYQVKYGRRDYRGGGRASARETAMRVAAGAIAKKILFQDSGCLVRGFLDAIGQIELQVNDLESVNSNPFFCPEPAANERIAQLINELREAGDSIGARVGVLVSKVPPGLGEPVFDKLDAELAYALMSINAVKGIEIGAGFSVVQMLGSDHRDEMDREGFRSNQAGGILGGISTGQDITIRIALKPTSSISVTGNTVCVAGHEHELSIKGRHDPCVGLRAVPVAEAMVALVLADHLLRDRAQNFDVARKATKT